MREIWIRLCALRLEYLGPFARRIGLLLLSLSTAQVCLASDFVRHYLPLDEGALSFLYRSGRAPALILIPGSFWGANLWEDTVPHLDPDMALVLVELRGHGSSWPPAQNGSIEMFASDVLGVADSLGLTEFYVGGHSIGGMVALEVGRRRPDAVLGIASIEGWTNFHAAADAFDGRMADTLTPELRKRESDGRATATGRWTDEQRTNFARIWRQWDGAGFLHSTRLPVLELYGDRGRPKPTLRQLRIPERENVKLRWIEGASHNLPLERPAEVGQAIRGFIEGVESQRLGGSLDGRTGVENSKDKK